MEIPVEVIDGLVWLGIALVVANSIIVLVVVNGLRDAAQQRHTTRDSMIKNLRADILNGMEAGRKFREQCEQDKKD